jgi:uncharacterized membrane protein
MNHHSANTCLVIGPNASMSVRQAVLFMGWMCAAALAIAGFFAVQGYWPILPFAGLELAALGAALAVSLRRNGYREVVRFEGDTVCVEKGEISRGLSLRLRLPRNALRVLLEHGPYRNSPTRLLLSWSGQQLELGRCLTDGERERVAQRMRELVHPGFGPGWRRAPAGGSENTPAGCDELDD